ncbi:MAG: hypothetical protein DRN40_08210 [Thermoplasmata archaeon]|nr:MAG: hypothetical protein DRN40_08210 [Thermoplasmata archaeon]
MGYKNKDTEDWIIARSEEEWKILRNRGILIPMFIATGAILISVLIGGVGGREPIIKTGQIVFIFGFSLIIFIIIWYSIFNNIKKIYVNEEGLHYKLYNGKYGIISWDRIHKMVSTRDGLTSKAPQIFFIEYRDTRDKVKVLGAVNRNAGYYIINYIRKRRGPHIPVIYTMDTKGPTIPRYDF